MISDRIDDSTKARLNSVLTVVLAIALVVSLGGVVYVAMTPGAQEDPFTEFYILGPGGEAGDYPTNLTTGETGEFTVGITNNEQTDLTYTIALVLDGEVIEERQAMVGDSDTWEDEFTYTPGEPGEKRLEILLFRGDEVGQLEEPYDDLRLVIDVRES